ncbi:T-cell receptor beta-1 chain C region [Symphorus nematophorus]
MKLLLVAVLVFINSSVGVKIQQSPLVISRKGDASVTLEYLISVNQYEPAYFGRGTKLTVLDKDVIITPPQVKILPPSEKECRSKKDGKKKKTLVCVATEFYPDHVSVRWMFNKDNVTDGVATDTYARNLSNKYQITSRLRVSAQEWHNPENTFECIVTFYDGKESKDYTSIITGTPAQNKGGNMTRADFMKLSQAGKLTYSVLIAKSSLYGAFVAFVVWRHRSSKRSD